MTYEELWQDTFIRAEKEHLERLKDCFKDYPESRLITRLLKECTEALNHTRLTAGKNINEPVPSICKDILNNPDKYEVTNSEDYLNHYVGYYGIVDTETKVEFVVGYKSSKALAEIMDMDFLTEDEVKILARAVRYKTRKVKLEEEQVGRMKLSQLYLKVGGSYE